MDDAESDHFVGLKGVMLRPSLCAFVDILGFSERVRRAALAKKSPQLLAELLAVFREGTDLLRQREYLLRELEVRILSDSVVVGFPIPRFEWPTMLEPELWGVIGNLGTYLNVLAQDGFFCRGGLAAGELHFGPELIFGEALVNAAILEKKAEFPRVVISKATIRVLRHHLTFYGGDPEIQYLHLQEILVDEDGHWFINYLVNLNWNELGTDFDALENHAQRISAARKDAPTDSKMRRKYDWLAAYHNFFVGNCITGSEECPIPEDRVEKLRLPTDFPSTRFRLLDGRDALRIPEPET